MASGPGDPGRTSRRQPNTTPSYFPTPASHAGQVRCANVATGIASAAPPELPVYRHPSTNGLGRPDGAGPAPTNRGRPPALPYTEITSQIAANNIQSVPGEQSQVLGKQSFSRPPSVAAENRPQLTDSVSGAPDMRPVAEMDTSEAPADSGFTLVDGSRRRKRRKEANDGYASDSSCSSANTVCSRERIAPLPRREKIPPIVVQGMQKWNGLLRTLKASGLKFDAKFVGSLLHIMCETSDDFRAVQRYLTSSNLTFHTFCLREERELKVALRGLPHDTPEEEIKEELESLGFTPTNVIPLQRRDGASRLPCNTFLLKVKKTGSWASIWDVKHLFGVRVTVGEFRPRRGLNQCYNCQRYGHASFNCHLPPRCVKCGGPHSGRDCKTPQEDIPTCVNCGSRTHPASYKGCPSHKDAMTARRRRNQPRARTPSRSRPVQVRAPRTSTTTGVSSMPAAPTPTPSQPPQQPRPEPVQETETLPPAPRPSKPTVSYAAAVRRAPRPRRPRPNNNKTFSVTETETDTEYESAPAPPTVSAPGPKFAKPRQRAPKAATVTSDKPVVAQTATPQLNTVSTAALVQWMATLIPLILGSAHMQPAELLAAVLTSLQTLIAANGQAA